MRLGLIRYEMRGVSASWGRLRASSLVQYFGRFFVQLI